MELFLIGISWKDPEEAAAWLRLTGDDDCRCATGIFIRAETQADALSWGDTVAKNYLSFLFDGKGYNEKELEIFCWVEEYPAQGSWKHCLEFFQTVTAGQFPEYQQMTVEAYVKWCKKMGID